MGKTRKMSEEEFEAHIERVNATMALSDMPLTEELKNSLRDILQGRTTDEEVKRSLIKSYTKVD